MVMGMTELLKNNKSGGELKSAIDGGGKGEGEMSAKFKVKFNALLQEFEDAITPFLTTG